MRHRPRLLSSTRAGALRIQGDRRLEGRNPPRDSLDRGPWWSIYNDPELDWLERQVVISNQNVAAAEAAFHQSVALVQQARATLFPPPRCASAISI